MMTEPEEDRARYRVHNEERTTPPSIRTGGNRPEERDERAAERDAPENPADLQTRHPESRVVQDDDEVARRDEQRATDRSMAQRVEDERAAQVLRQVQDPAWWNRATAADLQTAQAVVQRGAANPATRARIDREMQHVARTRYGTSVQGAIEYERTHPTMPPPDLTQAHDGIQLSR